MANTYSLGLIGSSSQYASAADHPDFQFGSGDFTVMCWVKKEILNTDIVILGKLNGISNSGWVLRTNGTGNSYRFDLINSSIDNFNTTATFTDTGVWTHVAVTRSGTSVKMYINGVQDGSITSSKDISSVGNNLFVGRGVEDGDYYWTGKIDEVRIYKGRVLSSNEILKVYNRQVIDSNLSAYWNLNNVYTDSSGNGHTLSASGNPVFSTTVPFANYKTDATFLNFLA